MNGETPDKDCVILNRENDRAWMRASPRDCVEVR